MWRTCRGNGKGRNGSTSRSRDGSVAEVGEFSAVY